MNNTMCIRSTRSGRLVALLKRLLRHTQTIQAQIRQRGPDTVSGLLFFSLAAGTSTCKSIYILVKNGLYQDAIKLSRTEYELMVNTLWLMQEPEKRTKLFFEFVWQEQRYLYEEALKHNPELKPMFDQEDALHVPGRAPLAHVLAEAKRVCREHGFKGKDWSDGGVLGRLRDLGEIHTYVSIYLQGSSFVHGSPAVVEDYVSHDDVQGYKVHASESLADRACILAFHSLFRIARVCAEYFKLDEAVLNDLENRFTVIMSETYETS